MPIICSLGVAFLPNFFKRGPKWENLDDLKYIRQRVGSQSRCTAGKLDPGFLDPQRLGEGWPRVVKRIRIPAGLDLAPPLRVGMSSASLPDGVWAAGRSGAKRGIEDRSYRPGWWVRLR
jgi:hypothetical protein